MIKLSSAIVMGPVILVARSSTLLNLFCGCNSGSDCFIQGEERSKNACWRLIPFLYSSIVVRFGFSELLVKKGMEA